MHRLSGSRKAALLAVLLLGVWFGPFLLSRFLSNVGMVALSRGLAQMPDASTVDQLARALVPSASPDAAGLRGIALAVRASVLDQHLLDQAESWLALALRLDDQNDGAHRGLGWVWDARGNLQRAAEEWHQGGLTSADFGACANAAFFINWLDEAQRCRERAAAFDK